jgi:hypothetical protein
MLIMYNFGTIFTYNKPILRRQFCPLYSVQSVLKLYAEQEKKILAIWCMYKSLLYFYPYSLKASSIHFLFTCLVYEFVLLIYHFLLDSKPSFVLIFSIAYKISGCRCLHSQKGPGTCLPTCQWYKCKAFD